MPLGDSPRIAYVCADPGVPIFGRKGCSVHAQEVLRALLRRGARVELFAARLDGPPHPDFTRIKVHPLPSPPKGDPASRERALLAANDDLMTTLIGAGQFDLIYERYSLWGWAGMARARASGAPGLLEVNAPLIEEQAHYRSLIDRASAERVAERVFGLASGVVAVSEEVAAYVDRYPAARGRVHVIPNGVNPDRFPPDVAPACPARLGTFTVGFVGSLKPWHGLSILVEAFARLHRRDPNVRLLIVGEGPMRAKLEVDLAERGMAEAAQLTGAVTPDAVPGMLASMDVVVAPYPVLEHFYFSPLKVYEYMAAGRPCVASRIGQIEAIIEDGRNGLLCPPGDAAALGEALERLLRDPALRSRLGEAARDTVQRHHTWDAAVARILALAGQAVAT
jgi:glycosyltransferase involved in cell wall biosynthesis